MQQTAKQEFSDVGQSISQARQDLGQQIKGVEGETNPPAQEAPAHHEASKDLPRHEIIEEHHAVLPDSAEPNKITKT